MRVGIPGAVDEVTVGGVELGVEKSVRGLVDDESLGLESPRRAGSMVRDCQVGA